MLRTIREELSRAAAFIGGKQVTALAPIYLCASDLYTDTLNDAGELLLHALEEDGVFDPLQDACVLLSVTAEEHISDNEMRRIGLTDRFGQYRHSLSGWLKYLSTEMHITTGVILIRAEQLAFIRNNPDWWSIQLQSMESHKNAFVFVIAAAPKNLSELYDTVSPRCHAQVIEVQPVSPESFADIFASALAPYHLTLAEDGRACIVKAITECSNPVSILQIVRWARSTAWRVLTAGAGAAGGSLTAEQLETDEFLAQNHLSAAPQDKQRIGY